MSSQRTLRATLAVLLLFASTSRLFAKNIYIVFRESRGLSSQQAMSPAQLLYARSHYTATLGHVALLLPDGLDGSYVYGFQPRPAAVAAMQPRNLGDYLLAGASMPGAFIADDDWAYEGASSENLLGNHSWLYGLDVSETDYATIVANIRSVNAGVYTYRLLPDRLYFSHGQPQLTAYPAQTGNCIAALHWAFAGTAIDTSFIPASFAMADLIRNLERPRMLFAHAACQIIGF